jgi:hypothetical protein
MNSFILFAADIAPLLKYKTPSLTFLKNVVIFRAVAVVVIVILVWAVFLRKKSKRRRMLRRYHPYNSQIGDTAETDKKETKFRFPWQRRHRRYRQRRPRNPTLAETGGLPPMRDKDTPPPSL